MSIISYFTEHRSWQCKASDIVLDIGSGNDPILRANLLLDRYVDNDAERYSGIIVDRTLICADGISLPFKDKSIDFIHCRHLLEHIPDPISFFSELQRVGKRGVIITPHGDYEKIDPREEHLWYVYSRSETLTLIAKHKWNEYPEIQNYFHEITKLPSWWTLWGRHYTLFNTLFYWDESINYEIFRDGEFDFNKFSSKGFQATSEKDKLKLGIPLKFKIKSILGKFVRSIFVDKIDVVKLLKCINVNCSGDLNYSSNNEFALICGKCGRGYQVKDNIYYIV